jgi:DNA-binding LacI/PurR family transcriptional regulator
MEAVGQRMARPRAPTIYDVAGIAGVSHTTVSRAVNDGGGMTAETRRRILEIAADIGYEPNPSARVLAGRIRSQLAAVVVRGDESRSSGPLIEGLVRAARAHGCALTIVGVEPADERSVAAAAERIGEPGIRGVLLLGASGAIQGLGAVAAVPHVVVTGAAGRSAGGRASGSLPAASIALTYLRGLGHRVIARVAAADGGAIPDAAELGAVASDLEVVALPAASTAEAGFRAATARALPDRCTALLAPTVSFAAGFASGSRARGIRIPNDLSVVVLEDHPDAAHLAPSLTAVSAENDELAHQAVAALLDVTDGNGPLRAVRAAPRLVVRDSTGPVRESHGDR